MRKILFLAGLTATTPLFVAPVLTTNQLKNTLNLKDVVIDLGNGNNYTVRFKNDASGLPGYAEIHKMHIEHDIDRLVIPATIRATDGKDYPLRTIATAQFATGSGSIKLLDLSNNNNNLREIAKESFGRNVPYSGAHCSFSIRAINWNGARGLRKIGENAFREQVFDSTMMIGDEKVGQYSFNFLDTNIERIEKFAFYNCCLKGKNQFEDIVLPPSIKHTGDATFGDSHSGCCARFKNIIFTSLNPDEVDMRYSDSMPKLIEGQLTSQIIVPHGTLEKFKKKKYFGPVDKAHESSIWYDEQHSGTKRVGVHTATSGVDDRQGRSWKPFDGTSLVDNATITIHGGPGSEYLYIDDSTGRLCWNAGAPVGECHFFIVGEITDNHGLRHLAISDMCRFVVVDGKLTGVQRIMKGIPSAWGYSPYWTTEVTLPYSAYWDTTFDLQGLTPELRDKIRPIKNLESHPQGYIQWDEGLKAGTYNFLIQPGITMAGVDNVIYFPTVPVTLAISDGEITPGITLYTIDGSTQTPVLYEGQTLELPLNSEYYVQVSNPQGATVTSLTPSSTVAKLETLQDSRYKIDTTKPGSWQFNFYEKQTVTGIEGEIPIRSDYVRVKVGDTTPKVVESNAYLTTQKRTEEYKFLVPIVSSETKATIKSVVKTPAVWYGEYDPEKESINQNIVIEVTEDKKAINVVLPKRFWSGLWPDSSFCFDMKLTITLEDTPTNAESVYEKDLSLIVANTGVMKYDGERSLLAYENSGTYTFEAPFEYLLNGESGSKLYGLTFSASVVNDRDHKYVSNFRMQQNAKNNTALLTCEGIKLPEGEESLTLLVEVGAWDPTNTSGIPYASTQVSVTVGNEIHIESAPSHIMTQSGIAGKSQEPIRTIFNGELCTSDLTYNISGYPEENVISVDQDGFINWTNKLAKGEYTLDIEIVANKNGKTFRTSTQVQLHVEQGPTGGGINLGAVIGGSLGGAAVVAGGTAGTTIGIKKHKAKLIKK